MATETFTITIAATSALPPPYGFDDLTLTTAGNLTPYEPIITVDSGDTRILGINDYGIGVGIEIWFNSSVSPPGSAISMPYTDITEIRLGHSGGTLTLIPIATPTGDLDTGSSYVSLGETYMWFNGFSIWTVADVGQQYTVEFDTTVAAPPTGPDYNLGTRVVNRKNPGGGVAFAEAAYTTTQTAEITQAPSQQSPRGGGAKGKGQGAEVIVNLPSQGGTFNLTCHIEGYDFGSGTWYPILSGANITGGSTQQRLRVAPAVADVANVSANNLLPYMWRVRMEHGDATEVTYSVAYRL
jgi:hypothetical protein